MIQAFKRSRTGSRLVMAAAIVISVVIWFRDRDYPVFIPIIASTLMLGIGYFSSRVVGNLLANMENTRYLGYLHMELDPPKFLSCYRDVPGQLKPGSEGEAVYRSYLADGYAAAGDFDTALELNSRKIPTGNIPLRGLYASNRCAYCLGKEDVTGAEEAIAELEEIIDASRLKKAELAKNLSQNLAVYREHINCLTGSRVDTEALENAFRRAQYHIRRLEIKKVLAMTALRDSDAAAAKEHLTFLRKNGGKTHFKRWADQQ